MVVEKDCSPGIAAVMVKRGCLPVIPEVVVMGGCLPLEAEIVVRRVCLPVEAGVMGVGGDVVTGVPVQTKVKHGKTDHDFTRKVVKV